MIFNKSLYRVFLAIVLLLQTSNAISEDISEDISFDYVEMFYSSDTVDTDSSIDNTKGDGIGFVLSLGFSTSFAMKLAVSSTTFRTFQNIDVDSSKMSSLGVTAHTSVASGTAIFGDLSALKAETVATVGAEEISDDDIGGIISIGLRHVATEGLELELVATHMDVFGYTVNGYKASGRLFIRKKFSIGFGYSDNDDLELLFLNVRMNI